MIRNPAGAWVAGGNWRFLLARLLDDEVSGGDLVGEAFGVVGFDAGGGRFGTNLGCGVWDEAHGGAVLGGMDGPAVRLFWPSHVRATIATLRWRSVR